MNAEHRAAKAVLFLRWSYDPFLSRSLKISEEPTDFSVIGQVRAIGPSNEPAARSGNDPPLARRRSVSGATLSASVHFEAGYPHYAFDLWAHQWRRRHARGQVTCELPRVAAPFQGRVAVLDQDSRKGVRASRRAAQDAAQSGGASPEGERDARPVAGPLILPYGFPNVSSNA